MMLNVPVNGHKLVEKASRCKDPNDYRDKDKAGRIQETNNVDRDLGGQDQGPHEKHHERADTKSWSEVFTGPIVVLHYGVHHGGEGD